MRRDADASEFDVGMLYDAPVASTGVSPRAVLEPVLLAKTEVEKRVLLIVVVMLFFDRY
jgi:hypothetical protein